MSLRAVAATPCWVMTHEADSGDAERITHLRSRVEADTALWHTQREAKAEAETLRAKIAPGHYDHSPAANAEVADEWRWARESHVRQEAVHCQRIVCDRCGVEFDMDGDARPGRGMHVSPDQVADWVDHGGWTSDGHGHHHCGGCPVLYDCDHDPDEDPQPYCPRCVNPLTILRNLIDLDHARRRAAGGPV